MFEWIPAYERFLVDITLIDIVLVVSLMILFQCGLFSMATAGFAAIGAYTSTLLVTDAGLPVPLGIVASVVVGGALGCAFGLPVLRLRGIYLALGSLALAQVIVVVISNAGFTNGVFGISGIPTTVNTETLVGVVVVVLALMELFRRSHFGRAMRAIRLDENTARGVGINVFAYRLTAFTVGSALAGLAGSLEAHRTGVISPDQYDFALLVVIITYTLVGGVEHWIGPVVATVAFRLLEQNLDFVGSDWEAFVYGGVLVAVMIAIPDGLTGRAVTRHLGRLGNLLGLDRRRRDRRQDAEPSVART